jgi:peptide deformylase
MKLEMIYYGDPILRKKGELVEVFDEDLKNFVKDMEDTMFAANGIGLAAPQVNRAIRVFITNPMVKGEDGKWNYTGTRVYINPKIVEFTKENWIEQEGCLSIPKIYEDVSRPIAIKIEAQDVNGQVFTEDLSGWEAKTFLHENDHINGVLFIDRVFGKRRKELDPLLNDIKRKFYLKK